MSKLIIEEGIISELDKSYPADKSGETYTVNIGREDDINGEGDKTNNANA